jgi:hypothetical protein
MYYHYYYLLLLPTTTTAAAADDDDKRHVLLEMIRWSKNSTPFAEIEVSLKYTQELSIYS